MGILRGPLSLRRYQVVGDLPSENFRKRFCDILQAGVFKGFDNNSEQEKVFGWACAQDPLDLSLQEFKLFFNEYFVFTLRVDTRRVPPSALRMYAKKAEEEHLAQVGRPHLSRNEKKEIKNLVRKKLLQQILPSTKTYDVLWNINAKRLDFWSTSDKLNFEFSEIFEKHFSLRLRPLGPFLTGVALFPDLEDRLRGIMPSAFAHNTEILPQAAE